MPQPKPGQGSANVDVMVHGTGRSDGTVRDASIDISERADLNAEALQLFSSWRFTPATCDGTALEIPAEITAFPKPLMAESRNHLRPPRNRT
jgi:TonB family protein